MGVSSRGTRGARERGRTFRGGREVMREERRKGRGGTFWREAAWRAELSCRFSSTFASVRILEAKQSRSSCGIQTWGGPVSGREGTLRRQGGRAWPLGSTRSPVRLVRQAGWFSASATGFCAAAGQDRASREQHLARGTHHEPHIARRLADGLLHDVRALSHVGVVAHRLPVGPVRRRGGGVREHDERVEPHGGAERVGDCAQQRQVPKVGAVGRVQPVEVEHDVGRAALRERLRFGLGRRGERATACWRGRVAHHDAAVVARVRGGGAQAGGVDEAQPDAMHHGLNQAHLQGRGEG